ATVVNSVVACAICLTRASSSDRMRSSIKGTTRITASNASRARIPRTCLSFARLRLRLMLAICATHPARNLVPMVQEAFLELGKIGTTSVETRVFSDVMIEANALPLTGHSPNALAAVEQEIARACKDAQRDRAAVTLIAVSKTFAADAITPVIAAGQRVFGENRVQEAKAKWPALISSNEGIALHLIGPLQSNQAK